jgi:monoamine oxidase
VRNPGSSEPRPSPITVVGAGLAGLVAAVRLDAAGAAVTILEARDVVGGRVRTVELENGAVAELGAEWIEENESAVQDLAAEFGLTLAPAGVDYRRRPAMGSLAASLDEQEAALGVARRALKALPPEAITGRSLGEFIDGLALSDHQRATLRARLQGTCARDLHEISLRVAERGTFSAGSGRYFRIGEGNQSLADAMARRLGDVRLRHVVERIRRDDGGVTVSGGGPGGSFCVEAAAAVVAIPAPVAAALRFDPPLPGDRARALRDLPMGVASKLAVATSGAPSPRTLQEVDVPFWCWAALGMDGQPRRVLTSFAGSPAAQATLATDGGDPQPWLARLLALNPDVATAGEPRLKAWAADPFAGGCYSAFDDAAWDRRDLLAAPVGRLIFAGEHTAGLSAGTMNGAVRSGARAAAEILEILETV